MIGLADSVHPGWLWVAGGIALAWPARLCWLAWLRRAQRSTGATTAAHLGGRLASAAWLREGLLVAGMICAAVAAARPRGDEGQQGIRTGRGADIVVAIDCSRSMLATDVFPDRIAVARRKVQDLLDLAPEHRMALLPYAGRPFLRAPFTGDAAAIGELLQDCSPDLFPAQTGLQGSAMGKAVADAIALVARSSDRGGCVLVVSDGGDSEGDEAIATAAEIARNEGVPVFGLFLGDPNADAAVTIDGRTVQVPANMVHLETLATRSGGTAVSLSTDMSDVNVLQRAISAAVPGQRWEEQQRLQARERYLWWLIPAIGCLGAGLLMPTARRRRRETNKTTETHA